MDKLYNKTQYTENLFNRKKTVRNAVLLIFRYWGFYVFMSEKNYLHKAYHVATTMKAMYPSSLPINYCLVFLDLQMDNRDKALALLDILSGNKNFLKANNPDLFNIYQTLESLSLIKADKPRAAYKKSKHITNTEYLAFLEIEQGQYESAYELIHISYKNGIRSYLLFLCMYLIFVSKAHVEDKFCIFPTFAKWSIKEGLNIDKAINIYQDSIIEALASDLPSLIRIYQNYSRNWILELICLNCIARYDYSQNALEYYSEAETKQIYVEHLDAHLVKAAYVNEYENISHFTLEKFLTKENEDFNLKSFVYHLLTSNEKYSDLKEKYSLKIIQFAIFALDLNERNRYFYSIYSYFLTKALEKKLDEKYIKKCSLILYNKLLTFDGEFTNPDIYYVWILDHEKKDHEVFIASSGKITIKSVSNELKYLCFDESGKKIINESINFKKSVEIIDIEVYKYFWSLYPNNSELVICLAREYMSLKSLPNESIDVLNSALEKKNISRNFKMQITAALGNLLAGQNRYDKAISYYNAVDENFLSDRYIEQMLISFINAKEFEKALNLIIKKSHCVSERSLFSALKQIAVLDEYNESIADMCYELLLKSWYDKSLIDIVVDFYKGSQQDLIELSSVLANMQASEFKLDKKILQNSIWMHSLDSAVQKVFIRVYSSFPDSEISKQYVYYLCYEILVQNTKLDYPTIEVLEKHFMLTNGHLLGYALSHLYLEHSITTYSSNRILQSALDFMEEDELLFPYVTEIKDKSLIKPYIIKNRPFIYRTLPNKTVYLYYRLDSSPNIYQVRMKYFKFGIYLCTAPHFYNEKLIYYFSEEMASGSINTSENEITNIRFNIFEAEEKKEDEYFTINNALIYEHMFRYEEVEKIISTSIDGTKIIKGHML